MEFKLYNGCPNDELKAYWDEIDKLTRRMKSLNPNAHCTYFPNGEFFHIFDEIHIVGPEFRNKIPALQFAIEHFSKPKE